MLDFFAIFTKGGILLWYFRAPDILPSEWASFRPSVNAFIKSVLLQEMAAKNSTYETGGTLALKYKLDNEFELVFVAGYQKMLPLLYLDKLLDEIQLRFRDKYLQDLKQSSFFRSFEFAAEFDEEKRSAERWSMRKEKEKSTFMKSYEKSDKSDKTIGSMIVKKDGKEVARPSPSTTNNNVNKGKGVDKAAAAAANAAPEEAGGNGELTEEQRLANLRALQGKKGKKAKSPKAEKKGKEGTKWDQYMFPSNRVPTREEVRNLDRSAPAGGPGDKVDMDHQMSQFVPDASVIGNSADIRDIEEEDEDDHYDDEPSREGAKSGGFWSSLTSLVGNKTLTRGDIEPVISKMQDHLIAKNVAADVAVKLCESVANNLEGKVLGTFSSIHRSVKDTLTESLMKLLTPKRRIDIIRDVIEAKANKRPYVITFCGVNGVGKSTNLAKICFWLVENKCSVLIAACDTFRAGAVEQLRTHQRRLNNLHPAPNGGKPFVELYEKGYGKDAAGIALEAINHARNTRIDVVLVDTAGRMQDNEPLMRALSKLISVNDPDLVLFVGEALVGNEAVDQLVKFNSALADHSAQNNPHLIDGIVLTKFDTIDDKVGSSISMTYITGQPIIFVGTGQTYTDLKNLNAKAVVQALMK